MSLSRRESYLASVAKEYRNATPLLPVLRFHIEELRATTNDDTAPSVTRVLEIGAGAADHAVFFTYHLNDGEKTLSQADNKAENGNEHKGVTNPLPRHRVDWLPTDMGDVTTATHAALAATALPPTILRLPRVLDVLCRVQWDALTTTTAKETTAPLPLFDMIFTSCTFHIMPFEAVLATLEDHMSLFVTHKLTPKHVHRD